MQVQDKMKKNILGEFIYKKSLLGALAITRAFEKVNYPSLSHWKSIFDTLSISSSIVHSHISLLDEEVQKEFEQKEEQFTKVINRENKLYSEDELKELCKRQKDISLPD